MTVQETLQTMSVLRAAYPHFYSKMSTADANAAVKLWSTILKDYPYNVVNAAIVALIATRTSTFPPVPGEVVAQIHKLTEPEKMDGSEAWGLVKNALRNSLYGFHEEFNKLPASVRAAVRSENQLREWAMMEAGEIDTVVASNFQKSYRITAARDEEWQRLPSSVRTFVSGLLESGALPKLEDADHDTD